MPLRSFIVKVKGKNVSKLSSCRCSATKILQVAPLMNESFLKSRCLLFICVSMCVKRSAVSEGALRLHFA